MNSTRIYLSPQHLLIELYVPETTVANLSGKRGPQWPAHVTFDTRSPQEFYNATKYHKRSSRCLRIRFSKFIHVQTFNYFYGFLLLCSGYNVRYLKVENLFRKKFSCIQNNFKFIHQFFNYCNASGLADGRKLLTTTLNIRRNLN